MGKFFVLVIIVYVYTFSKNTQTYFIPIWLQQLLDSLITSTFLLQLGLPVCSALYY